MPSSHRHLVHRHIRRLLSKRKRDLLPGEVRFFSYYQPSLQGGIHTLKVSQEITIPGETDPQKIEEETQDFNVIAPRFNLPPGVVDSDPHLPWEQEPTFVDREADKKDLRNHTPWLLLLTFSPDELKLDDGTLKDVVDGLADVKAEQSETMAVRMRVNQAQSLKKVVNAIPYDPERDEHDAEGPLDAIFVKKDLFVSLCTNPVTKSNKPDVSQYKYLAHVRQVATDGMAVAGGADKENDDSDLFSIVVAPRTGPLNSTVPITNIVHLVSLNTKSSEKMQPELASDKDRVALVSLHSWSYTCIPSEGEASPRARLVNLGENLTVFHPLIPTPAKKQSSGDEAFDRMDKIIAKRQEDGYTLVRHRTITGETTAAMIRGPFSPKFVPHPLVDNFSIQSNFGSDLQILDPVLSLMDITYASAWQLGKTLAMGDEAFCAALARLRNLIHGSSLGSSKVDVHSALGVYRSRLDTLGSMRDLVQGLNSLNEGLHQDGDAATAVDSNRWDYTHPAAFMSTESGSHRVNMSMHSPHISTRMVGHADAAALSQAIATDGELYNEHKAPENADFAHVYSWVLDKLHLANIPAHYLIPDTSFLPQETLRFFYLDENWTDALVDGALSLANHWASSPEKDFCRTAIKKTIQKRLDEPDPSLGGWHVQMPRYGFILRSQLLVQFPDIAVNVEYAETRTKAGEAPKAPILVQKTLSDDIIITFTMPPHQQRFTIGSDITPKDLTVSFKKVYTEPDPNNRLDKDSKTPIKEQGYPMDAGEIFDLTSRTIKAEPKLTPHDFSDKAPSSTLLALQLNESIPELLITLPQSSTSTTSSPHTTFRFSLPHSAPSQPPPPLSPLPHTLHAPLSSRISHSRPRPPSPRLEAALIAHSLATMPRPLTPPPTAKVIKPEFDVSIHALRNRAYISTSSSLPLDLVIKIVRIPTTIIPTHALTDIEVSLPWGDMPPPGIGATVPLLARRADPPTAEMLSNLRFNILRLVFKLVPRGKGGVKLKGMQEASILVGGAEIVRYKEKVVREATVDVTFSFTEDNPRFVAPAWAKLRAD
ncbi:hypothetical protein B0T18DRAFT_466613 [Schizothecium vesticola]|uniref:Uncharacterized protein n=1 Tax=Schizothecium vesticola TaxID=314040 RepID=A0AA40EWV8_9PEZI|nr:hypothetical protein B0T18DRAFT_466613 [Schizothecium vesticola]